MIKFFDNGFMAEYQAEGRWLLVDSNGDVVAVGYLNNLVHKYNLTERS